MQIQCDHIGGSEAILWQMGEKEFVDHALVGVTDAALFPESRVGRHHDATVATRLPYRNIRAVVGELSGRLKEASGGKWSRACTTG